MTEQEIQEEIYWRHENARRLHDYDVAYYKSIFCPEAKRPEAEERLKILRHKFFSW